MIGDGDEPDAAALRPGHGSSRPPLRAVVGPLGSPEPPRATKLRREFKGLTVADLLVAELAEQLPGRVRSALHQLERGDLAAAERALPGEFARVLPGPGHRRRRRVRWRRPLLLLLAAIVLAAAAAVVA